MNDTKTTFFRGAVRENPAAEHYVIIEGGEGRDD